MKSSGVEDMVLLPKIQEAAIVDNLKKRLMDDLIFVSFLKIPPLKCVLKKLLSMTVIFCMQRLRFVRGEKMVIVLSICYKVTFTSSFNYIKKPMFYGAFLGLLIVISW